MRLWGVVRVAAVALAGAWLVFLAGRYSRVINRWLGWREPAPVTAPLPIGDDELQRRASVRRIRQVNEEYARVKAKVDAAKASGLDVSLVEPLLLHSLSFAREKRYDYAVTLLNRIEVSIPRRRERVIPARADDPPPREPDIPSRPTAQQPKRPRNLSN